MTRRISTANTISPQIAILFLNIGSYVVLGTFIPIINGQRASDCKEILYSPLPISQNEESRNSSLPPEEERAG